MNLRVYLRILKFWLKSKVKRNMLDKKSDSELFSLLRHEGHRIEKSHYNNVFDKHKIAYSDKKKTLIEIIAILVSRKKTYEDDPSVIWAKEIVNHFDDFIEGFIRSKSCDNYERGVSYETYYNLISNRRSCRVWASDQLSEDELLYVSKKLIQAAIVAPNSGNRQGWRFKTVISEKEKLLFKGIKEKHTYEAPMILFVGVDKRLFFAYGKGETSFYVDSGAAVQNMITAAQTLGLDTCWNHFARDFIVSRKSNVVQYRKICEELNIPAYIEPIAILAVGKADFIPPEPKRMSYDEFVL